MSVTKRETVYEIYDEFKSVSRDYIEDCSIFPPREDLVVKDLLYYINTFFTDENYYESNIKYMMTVMGIKCDKMDEVLPIIIDFIQKLKSI